MARLLHYRAQLKRKRAEEPGPDGAMPKPVSVMYASEAQMHKAVEGLLSLAENGDVVELWKVSEDKIGVFPK